MARFMPSVRSSIVCIALMLAALVAAYPGAAQNGTMAMLDSLQPGQWEVRFRDAVAPRRICVRNGRELLQLAHRGACQRYVISDSANAVDVQYSCQGTGYGRTMVRRETNTLVQIDSQGFVNGSPFAWRGEARRVGACR